MASKAALTRLQKEYKFLMKEPVPGITAHPSPSNILEWHFVLEGQLDSEYAGGLYHGKVTFPAQYPYKPPSIQMVTPNGRFATNTRLCLSMTDFHPESWNPMWSVATILTGLYSFMHETAHTTGAISTSKAEKEKMARESLAFNIRNPTFKKLFPEMVQRYEEQQRAGAAASAQQQARAQEPVQQQQQATAGQPPLEPGAQQGAQQAQAQQPAAAGVDIGAGGERRQHVNLGWQGWALGAAGIALLAVLLAAAMGSQPGALRTL